jgi:hypothetical protein
MDASAAERCGALRSLSTISAPLAPNWLRVWLSTKGEVERETGLEPATFSLEGRDRVALWHLPRGWASISCPDIVSGPAPHEEATASRPNSLSRIARSPLVRRAGSSEAEQSAENLETGGTSSPPRTKVVESHSSSGPAENDRRDDEVIG